MGVSGSGKTTLGKALAQALGAGFVDADDLHPLTNRAKMAAGIPLTDDDRASWLDSLRQVIVSAHSGNLALVVACSALKDAYRRQLDPERECQLVYLRGSRAQLAERLARRQGHFFDPDLLESQLDLLEEPQEGIILDIGPAPDRLLETVLQQMKR